MCPAVTCGAATWARTTGTASKNHATDAAAHCGLASQVLPFCSEETLEQLERNLSTLPSVTEMLNSGLSAQGITDRCGGRGSACYHVLCCCSLWCTIVQHHCKW